MTTLPTIRPMRLEDLDRVLEIEVQVYRDTWSRSNYRFEIEENRFSLPVVMELEGQVIGYSVAWLMFEEFHIATIAVDPAFQRRGYGEFLLRAILGMSDDAEYALLEVRKTNHKALSLYKKYGFRQYGVRRRYYRDGEDALVLRKELK
ncbi:MAG: ribosomal protein S18-alanine N-acetyltransferase [Calditrichaeota bacterium]|nr:ribosomal protein S18-alanine N-acetyltransferase [Calditrichota bacterium]MCB9089648.1 ribosomal protein S18-alanine N-acetyltransferase [Calditrichia bacterium]MCB0290018.1 ribosomal protein S18-alanine N-acetyltransferase [Calditrichota bacterium]MCB0295540.1 ribosomal protein S18-alanine N-acetyltransferase [Calditrichota bacterium]MCB0304700.1 ribosomal protein S18-alanine N-acetyltransferase [Calditrichota bacterium]